VAPRPHHLVLRDVPARAARAGLPAVRRGLEPPLQLLLRRGRPASCAARARPAHPPHRRRGGRLSARGRRPGPGAAPGPAHRRAPGGRGGGGAGAPARAAAPGARPHRPPAPLLAQPAPTRLPRRSGSRIRGGAAPVGGARGRADRDRSRGARVRVRQRGAPPPRLPRAVPDRLAAGQHRRVPRVRGARRVRAAGALALRRMGRGAGRRVGGGATDAGCASRCTASSRSTRTRRSAT
jgi:hypothetical protein